jgi:hypothetical protein
LLPVKRTLPVKRSLSVKRLLPVKRSLRCPTYRRAANRRPLSVP